MPENDELLSINKNQNQKKNPNYDSISENKSNGFVDHEDTRSELKFEKGDIPPKQI